MAAMVEVVRGDRQVAAGVQLYSLVQLMCTVTTVVECTHFSSHLRELLLGGHPVSLDI